MTSDIFVFSSSPGDSVGVASMLGSPSSLPSSASGDYNWVSKDVTKVALIYNSPSSVVVLRSRISLLAAGDKSLFECQPCGKEERVFSAVDSGSIFMY